MSLLPKINEDVVYSPTVLPSGKTIGVKPWRVKEEKELLFATEGIEDQMLMRQEILKFISKCVDNQEIFKTLSNTDIIKLAMELRKQSKGDEIEFNYACEKCNTQNQITVSLTKAQKIKEFDFSPIKVNDKLTLTLKDVDFNTMYTLYDKYKDSLTKFNYYYMLESIDTLTYEGTVYTEFTNDDIIGFIDQLKSPDLDKIIKEASEKSSSIGLEKEFKCIKCREKNQVSFGDLYDFLVF